MSEITARILDDHHELRRAFAALDVCTGDDEALQLWKGIARLLETHAAAEEQIFYPALLDLGTSTEDETKDSIKDHNEIRDAIHAAENSPARSASWHDAVAKAREKNSTHMAEEERGVLAQFRSSVPADRRSHLAGEYDRFKERHRGARGIDDANKPPEEYVTKHEARQRQ